MSFMRLGYVLKNLGAGSIAQFLPENFGSSAFSCGKERAIGSI